MIGSLQGTILTIKGSEIWLEVHGVGYRVRVGETLLKTLVPGSEQTLYIHTSVREDAINLYGFVRYEELQFFEVLLSVSGVGPKIALTIVGKRTVDQVAKAIREADVTFFTNVPGIGKKGAQRIIVDLKSKIGSLKELDLRDEESVDSDDVTLALLQFGFKRAEIREALKGMDESLQDDQKIRYGLKQLGRRA